MEIIRKFTHYDIINMIKNNKNHTIRNSLLIFLGKGGEGIVYRIAKTYFAMKIYKSKSRGINKEILVLQKLNGLMDRAITNNFLKMYGSYQVSGYFILLMGLLDGNLEEWVKIKHTDSEWYQMIFQVLYGLLVLQTHLKMYHSDMKPKNILFKNVNNQTYKYVINDKPVATITTNYLFIISDFGHSKSLLIDNTNDNIKGNTAINGAISCAGTGNTNVIAESIELCIENNLDLEHIAGFHKRLAVTIITNAYTLENLIEMGGDDEYFIGYMDRSNQEIEQSMGKYSPHIKKHMLFRALSYYLLEHDYFNIDDLPVLANSKIILPSKKIMEVLESLENVKGEGSLLNKIIEIGTIVTQSSLSDEHNNKFDLNTSLKI